MKRTEEKKEPNAEKGVDLLRTYFVSLLSCFLCCVMFLGTTYAWFSGGVSSVSNRIQAGSLKIQLIHENADVAANPNHQVFSAEVLSPERPTVTEELTVRNNGSMKLKYTLNLAVVDNNPLAENFTVTVKKGDVTTTEQLTNGLLLSEGTLDYEEYETFSVMLGLRTADQSVQGQQLKVVLCLAAQQVTGNGGIG